MSFVYAFVQTFTVRKTVAGRIEGERDRQTDSKGQTPPREEPKV